MAYSSFCTSTFTPSSVMTHRTKMASKHLLHHESRFLLPSWNYWSSLKLVDVVDC